MTRLALPSFEGPYPQYYSIITKSDGTTVMGQVRSIDLADKINSDQVGRVGSSTKKTLRKTKETTAKMDIWTDLDLAEVAVALGASATPTAGQTLKLDPTVAEQTLLVKNYDGESASATLKSTIYLYGYVPTSLSLKLDEDGEQVASIEGTLMDLYWVVA